MYNAQKITIVPLRSACPNLLANNEAFDLGFDVSVERSKKLLAYADLWIWNHRRIQEDEEEINSWDTCLVHRFQSEPVTGEADEASINEDSALLRLLAEKNKIN